MMETLVPNKFLNAHQKNIQIFQPGPIKTGTTVHFLCDTVLCTLLHVLPQFQREMFTEWR